MLVEVQSEVGERWERGGSVNGGWEKSDHEIYHDGTSGLLSLGQSQMRTGFVSRYWLAGANIGYTRQFTSENPKLCCSMHLASVEFHWRSLRVQYILSLYFSYLS